MCKTEFIHTLERALGDLCHQARARADPEHALRVAPERPIGSSARADKMSTRHVAVTDSMSAPETSAPESDRRDAAGEGMCSAQS